MTIQYFCPAWGNTLPFDEFCRRVKAAGYHGVEMPLPFEDAAKEAFLTALAKHGLAFLGQYYQSFEADLALHQRNYERHIRNLLSAKPVRVNCQTGKDYFTPAQNQTLFDLAARLAQESGVPILHETHRGKALFAAHLTREYLAVNPGLRLTLDISHWCNVHESLLADQAPAVEAALARTDHLHTRVGHPEGPQVNDPRAPEWAEALAAHLAWWDRVVAAHRQANTPLTVTTEFGPPTYLPTLPYTQQPVASQWEVNTHMLQLLQKRWG
jgi:sugar phosphate isomerase/epimerase